MRLSEACTPITRKKAGGWRDREATTRGSQPLARPDGGRALQRGNKSRSSSKVATEI
ncbi:MAG: hypothetical protein RL077_2257 [Verrucomicrobiota bacterium]